MTTLKTMLDTAAPHQAGGLSFHLHPDWMQGRTAFGGLSSAAALHAARCLIPDLPPLRSAMIAFVGPLAGDVRITATELRRGRNACFVRADVIGEAGIGLTATFVFVAPRQSRIDQPADPAPPFPPPAAGDRVFRGPAGMFLHNFEVVDDRAPSDRVEWLRWVRLADRAPVDPMIELLVIGDALPPAAIKLADLKAPLSSMTWQVNLLTDHVRTTDGWWLLRSQSEAARHGCSSQTMAIWNSDGVRIASGMQSVALFV